MEILIIGKQKISHSDNSGPMSVGEHHPAFKRVCSQVRSRLLPGAFASAPRCVRVCSQMRSSLGPDAAASAPAFADRFWDWIVNEGGRVGCSKYIKIKVGKEAPAPLKGAHI